MRHADRCLFKRDQLSKIGELSLLPRSSLYPILFAHKSTSKDLILHRVFTIGHDSLEAWLRDIEMFRV